MRFILLLFPLLFLSGCLEEVKVSQEAGQKTCFELTPISSGPPNSPILWDRCTGETWMLLREATPAEKGKPSDGFAYGWYRIERWAVENAVANP